MFAATTLRTSDLARLKRCKVSSNSEYIYFTNVFFETLHNGILRPKNEVQLMVGMMLKHSYYLLSAVFLSNTFTICVSQSKAIGASD
jgi:hypothetical protein